jgi:hypothetical protein
MLGLVPAVHAAAPQGSVSIDLLAETLRSEASFDTRFWLFALSAWMVGTSPAKTPSAVLRASPIREVPRPGYREKLGNLLPKAEICVMHFSSSDRTSASPSAEWKDVTVKMVGTFAGWSGKGNFLLESVVTH